MKGDLYCNKGIQKNIMMRASGAGVGITVRFQGNGTDDLSLLHANLAFREEGFDVEGFARAAGSGSSDAPQIGERFLFRRFRFDLRSASATPRRNDHARTA